MDYNYRKVRTTARYNVSFATESWEDIPSLTLINVTAHDAFVAVETWNQVHQDIAKKKGGHLCLYGIAFFCNMEVCHGES
jgi:hypothetical protein